MTIYSVYIGPIAALIAGVLILIVPRLLNYVIALYLIIIGVVGLFGSSPGGSRVSLTDTAPAAVQDVGPRPIGPSYEL